MPKYHAELSDIEFNLFDVLKIDQHSHYGMGPNDYKSILSEFNKFVENEVFPTREPSDAQGVKHVSGKVQVPACLKPLQKNYYENGWFALGFPEDMQGSPVSEAFNAACTSLVTGANAAWMMYPGLSRAALNVVRLRGTPEMKKTIVPKMMSGEWGGTMCLTEPGAGSDVGALKTTAKPLTNGLWSIKGTKIFISSGDNDLYQNIIHLVLARTPGGKEGSKGISLFVVLTHQFSDSGDIQSSNHVVCSKIEHKMGIHASATCELQFGQTGETKGWLIGEEFDGMANMFIMMNEARLYCGIQGESQANLAYLMARDYVTQRVQFGKEIIHHPDIKRNLLRLRAITRGMRALCLYTADLFDKLHSTKDQKYEGYIGLMTPICKSYCSEQGFQASVDALQAFGGYGYCTEYGIEQFVRDTKIATIYEGTNGIQAIDFMMRKILKDGGKAIGQLSQEIVQSVMSLDEKSFQKEKELLIKVLGSAEKVLKYLSQLAKENKTDLVLMNCTDFLQFAAQLFMCWRLMESAKIAQSKLAKASSKEEKAYLESKIVDFKTYCTYYVVHNLSLAKSITDFAQDLSLVEI
jgi:alkylation response protein AidB-like acyl-CoA dehydrogenase